MKSPLQKHLDSLDEDFRLLWGEAPPDSLKGKKGADVLRFIHHREQKLLSLVVEEIDKKRSYLSAMSKTDEAAIQQTKGYKTALSDLQSIITKVQGKV